MMSDRQGTWELGGTIAVGASEISQEPRSDESGLQTFRSSPDQKVGHIEKYLSDANLKYNFLVRLGPIRSFEKI